MVLVQEQSQNRNQHRRAQGRNRRFNTQYRTMLSLQRPMACQWCPSDLVRVFCRLAQWSLLVSTVKRMLQGLDLVQRWVHYHRHSIYRSAQLAAPRIHLLLLTLQRRNRRQGQIQENLNLSQQQHLRRNQLQPSAHYLLE